jgi:hypothetical protein
MPPAVLAELQRDLEEAMRSPGAPDASVSVRGQLEYARLALAEGDREKAHEHVAEARRLIEECGYGRRRPEVEALEAELR